MAFDHRVRGRWFRVLTPRHAHQPLSGEGARLIGGRLNRRGHGAFYLSADPLTAYAEYTQNVFDRPGLMCSYDVDVAPVVDLTNAAVCLELGIESGDLTGRWIDVADPPSQCLADRLIGGGWAGALYPSMQHKGGVNIVLWNWDEGRSGTVRLVDRMGEAPTTPIR